MIDRRIPLRRFVRLLLTASATAVLVSPGSAVAEAADVPVPSASFGMTEGDYVHLSSAPPAAASAHGWWTYPGKTELVADVTVVLQVNRGRAWEDVGSPGVERVRPGGGSANRANARVPCDSAESTEWRSVVDVDVVGRLDNPGKLITPARRLACGE